MNLSLKLLCAAVIGLTASVAYAVDTPAPVATPSAVATPTTETSTFTDAQKLAIEEVVRNLITKKEPDLVVKAAQEMQARQEAESTTKNQKALTDNQDKILNDANSPVGGNPKGDVTLVEFFDYQCGYCKMANETVGKLIQSDKNLKIVYKEFPILGPVSMQASKAALASVRQNKYEKFHVALMSNKERITDDVVFKVAKDMGLDVEKLKKDMADEAIDKMVKANIALGGEIGARGTPTFVVNGQIYPGAMQFEQLKNVIENARKAPKK